MERTKGLKEKNFVQCFISGLRDTSDDVSVNYSKVGYRASITTRKHHGGDDQGSQVIISKHYQSNASYTRNRMREFGVNPFDQKNISSRSAS